MGVASRGRGGVAVHGHWLAAWRVGALLALATAGAPQEGHGPFHEVTAAVFRQGVRRRGSMCRGRGHAAALLVCRVRVRVVVVSCGVHGLGPGDVVGGKVRAGGGCGLVKVGRGRVTVAAQRPQVGRRCCREVARGHQALFFVLGLVAARTTRTTGGRRRATGTAAGLALLQTRDDVRWRRDNLRERNKKKKTVQRKAKSV